MIDEKRIEMMELLGSGYETEWSAEEEGELFRLARLGLWAEKYKDLITVALIDEHKTAWSDERKARTAEALAALPKDTK